MQLSVLEHLEGLTLPRLHLHHEDWAAIRFATAVHVCSDPCCDCTDVRFYCVPDSPAGQEGTVRQNPWVFALDAAKRRISDLRREDAHTSSGQLARAMVRELTSQDWDALWQHLVGVKRAQAEHGDLDTFSPAFRNEMFAGDGTMVTYREIFPFDEGFPCATDQVEWRVDDHHCVNPRCSCCRPVLSFLRVSRGAGRRTAREVAAADYDYTSATFEATMVPAADAPPLGELVGLLRHAHADLDRRLEQRHKRLRALFKRAMERRKKDPPAPPALRRKAGRNDPCPCGSGKKFKRCCGRA